MKILQIGLGYFGKNHLRVWNELQQELYVAELDPKQHAQCATYNIPKERITTDYKQFLDKVDAVDIVTPTPSHFNICMDALKAGKDVFVEKPITMTSKEALELARFAEQQGRFIQTGHIFRFNPSTEMIKKYMDDGTLGKIRYIEGSFKGFKRARTDVGVTQTDSIHFYDLFNYLLGKKPENVIAVTKDFFQRHMDDTSITLLHYGDTLVKIESGYLPPGTHRDVIIMGDKASLVANVVNQIVEIHHNHHELINGIWTAIDGGITRPKVNIQEPLQLELKHFIECVKNRKKPLSDAYAGYDTLKIVEAVYQSSKEKREVPIRYD